MKHSFLPLGHQIDVSVTSPDISKIEAMYIPCRSLTPKNEHYIATALKSIAEVYLLPSHRKPQEAPQSDRYNVLAYADYVDIDRQFSSVLPGAPNSLTKCGEPWDLGLKRSAALRHARQSGIKKLLMIDEDIEVTSTVIDEASRCMNEFDVVSIIPMNVPDRSAFGDLLSIAGIRSTVFLTASCLLIDVNRSGSKFPNIYNEDWFYLLENLSRGSRLGFTIASTQYPKLSPSPSIIAFQEAHDFIAESWAIGLRDHVDLNAPSAWIQFYSERASLIDEALERLRVAGRPNEVEIATELKRTLIEIDPIICREEWLALRAWLRNECPP